MARENRTGPVVALLLAVLFIPLLSPAAQAARSASPGAQAPPAFAFADKPKKTATGGASPTVNPTPLPSAIPSPTVGVTQPPTANPSPTAVATQPPTPVPSPSNTLPSNSPTPQPTNTQAPTATWTPVPPTSSPTASATNPPAPTSTPVSTNTPVVTLTAVPTAMAMPSPTSQPTATRGVTLAPTLRPIAITPSPTRSLATATVLPPSPEPTYIPSSPAGTVTPTEPPIAGGNTRGDTGDSQVTAGAAFPQAGPVQNRPASQFLGQIDLNPGTIVFVAAIVGIVAAVCAYLVQKKLPL